MNNMHNVVYYRKRAIENIALNIEPYSFNLAKHIEYAESEFRTFEIVIQSVPYSLRKSFISYT